MPQVHRSFYTDQAYGGRTGRSSARSCPSWCEPLPGLGPAGGHVRRRPVDGRLRRLQVGAAPAGALRRGGEPVRRRGHHRLRTGRERPEDPRMFERVFGDRPRRQPGRPAWLLGRRTPATLPSLYVCCGTEDALIDDNRASATRAGRRDPAERPSGRRPRLGLLGHPDPGGPRLAAAGRPAEALSGGPARPARPRTGPPGRPAAPASRSCPGRRRRRRGAARRWPERRSGPARPPPSARAGRAGRPGSGVGLDDEHQVVGARLTGLHQQRHVVDQTASAGAAATSSAVRCRTSGCTMPSSRARASGSAKTRRPAPGGPARRPPSAPAGPKASTTAASPGLPGATTSRAMRSASTTTAPRSASSADTVLLPEPIPPVSPMRSTCGE